MKFLKFASLLLCCSIFLLLCGCTTTDRPALTDFNIEGSQFTYTAKADAIYKADSSFGESKRMEWLEMYLRDNHLCGKGYIIDNRNEILISKGLLGDRVSIHYKGHCKK